MGSEVYESPKSDLNTKLDKDFRLYSSSGNFDTAMIISIAILAVFNLILTAVDVILSNDFTLSVKAIGFTIFVVQVVFIIYCIKKVRGVKKDKSGEILNTDLLSIWGYTWRTFIVQHISIIVVAISLALTGLTQDLGPKTVKLTVLMGLVAIPINLIFIWVFYSRNRKEQILWFVLLFRGL